MKNILYYIFNSHGKMLTFCLLTTGILLVTNTVLSAKILTKTIEYKQGNAILEGYLAYDDSIKGKAPGILIIHQWKGIQEYEKKRAEQIAGLGYIAFALDMYGKGIRPDNAADAAKQAAIYRSDRKLMRQRARAGLDILKKLNNVDPDKIAVMGYCFGGGAALELARSGAAISGVACFHGNLDTPDPADAKNIKARILVLHGADDPYTKPEQFLAFEDEMRKAGIDWQIVLYGGAVHAFTDPSSGNDPSKGSAYNKKADERSWEEMKRFYSDLFGGK